MMPMLDAQDSIARYIQSVWGRSDEVTYGARFRARQLLYALENAGYVVTSSPDTREEE